MKAVVAAFNQEKALGAFSVIVQLHRWIDLRHYQEQTGLGTAFDARHTEYKECNDEDMRINVIVPQSWT